MCSGILIVYNIYVHHTQVSQAQTQDSFYSALEKIQPVVDFIHANHYARFDKRMELVDAVRADSLERYRTVVQRYLPHPLIGYHRFNIDFMLGKSQ